MTIVLMAVNVLAGRLITRLGARVLDGPGAGPGGGRLWLADAGQRGRQLLAAGRADADGGQRHRPDGADHDQRHAVIGGRLGRALPQACSIPRGRSAACWAWRSLVICFGIPSRRPCAACICRSASRWRCWRPARCAGFGWERAGRGLTRHLRRPLLHRRGIDRPGRAGMGMSVGQLKPTRRGLARQCQDGTERRPHLAGPLGVQLMALPCAKGWLRRHRDSRAVQVTPPGWVGLRVQLGIDPAAHRMDASAGNPAVSWRLVGRMLGDFRRPEESAFPARGVWPAVSGGWMAMALSNAMLTVDLALCLGCRPRPPHAPANLSGRQSRR